ncbi:MAG: hypothetical protein L6R36_007969 [Xanthoria steineri]|nr:MAG: hypothetical protein L6R36_007969 [Xanthoria steineri]
MEISVLRGRSTNETTASPNMDEFAEYPETPPLDQSSLPIEEEFFVLGRLAKLELDSPGDIPDALQSSKLNPIASLPLSKFEHNYGADSDIVPDLSIQNQTSLPDNDDIGRWPRRLLHIPSMTSLEWQPGNIYGDHVAPAYSAVSYTWGRYDLDIPGVKRQKKYKNVRGIEINGIDWPVPRINPDKHFHVDHFYNLIEQTCKPVDGADGGTEFLWLDVACIDQNNGPQKMAEIGRQAIIFQNARRVFIWLTTFGADKLTHVIDTLVQSSGKYMETYQQGYPVRRRPVEYTSCLLGQFPDAAMSVAKAYKPDYSPPSDTLPWSGAARASLDQIFIDPWFSSLWTLQEAFLCPKAYLVPLEASPIYQDVQWERSHTPVTLGALCSVAETLKEVVDDKQPSALQDWELDRDNPVVLKRWKYLSEVSTMLTQRGLSALASRNPMALYHVAQYRHTRNDKDRVYGIQQIFALRLGASAPGCHDLDPKVFNRFNLEDQLGAALVQQYPVASQLHNFTETADRGTGWRINASSTVPKMDIKSNIWNLDFQARSSFSTQKVGGQQWGVFNGYTCDLAQLAASWRSLRYGSCTDSTTAAARSPQQVLLDDILSTTSEFHDNDAIGRLRMAISESDHGEDNLKGLFNYHDSRRVVHRGQRQHLLTSALIHLIGRAFRDAPLVVLLLGSFADVEKGGPSAGPNDKYHVGLILTRLGTEVKTPWKRLGFCIWQYEYKGVIPSSNACLHPDLLGDEDQSAGWKNLSDTFG